MSLNKYITSCVSILGLIFSLTASLNAQVTIGSGESPDDNALLDLKEKSDGTSAKGLLLPRVALTSTSAASPLTAHVKGMSVYNTATANDVTPGYYFNDGSKWQRILTEGAQAVPKFFYMPSVVLPTDTADPSYNSTTQEFTLDLYTLYAEQFGLSNSTSSTKSTGATTLPVLGSSALEYYITYYDNTVFTSVALDNSGILKYKLGTQITISEKTFMNIVFKVK